VHCAALHSIARIALVQKSAVLVRPLLHVLQSGYFSLTICPQLLDVSTPRQRA
jgi:hypothetical protein